MLVNYDPRGLLAQPSWLITPIIFPFNYQIELGTLTNNFLLENIVRSSTYITQTSKFNLSLFNLDQRLIAPTTISPTYMGKCYRLKITYKNRLQSHQSGILLPNFQQENVRLYSFYNLKFKFYFCGFIYPNILILFFLFELVTYELYYRFRYLFGLSIILISVLITRSYDPEFIGPLSCQGCLIITYLAINN